MILKNLNYNYSKTSKWIYPLFAYHNLPLTRILSKLKIIGVALGDLKHGIINSLVIVVNSSNAQDIVNQRIKDLIEVDPRITTYSYFNSSELLKIIVIPLTTIPEESLNAVIESRYSDLWNIYKTKIQAIYPFSLIGIIKKEPNAINNFKVAQSARLNIAAEDVVVNECETEFIKEKELLFLETDLEDFNIRNLLENSKGKLLSDLKISLSESLDIDKTVLVHNYDISKHLCRHLIEYLESNEL